MFRKAILLLILLFAAGCSQQSAGVTPSPPLTPSFDSNIPNGSLRYFGFAIIDCGWDDPHDQTAKTNYVDEIAGFSNVGQMCVYAPDELLNGRFSTFAQADVQVILHVEPLLFTRKKKLLGDGVTITLREDAEQVWTDFVALNANLLTPAHVAAIYVADEPAWNGIPEADFVQALQLVKTALPSIPTMSIEASGAIEQIMIPELLDWIGFDNYDTLDPATDPTWLAQLAAVRTARTRPDQKIVIVASTQWLPYYASEGNVQPEDMAAIIESYYRVADSYPDVVALVGYLWPGGLDDPEQIGARDLPDNVRLAIGEIGKAIIEE